ncbi:MAG TPA: NAD(P)-binding domain-containing protein [Taishania sp.]|nr:NAD(P)-binding domain-containing protein [Taishania sp.]
MKTKKIAVIGSGAVAQTLAEGFNKHGFQVMIGTRSPEKLEDWLSKNKGVSVASTAETAKFGDIVVLAVKGSVARLVVEELQEYLNGKTVIDTTNPIAESAPENGVLKFFTDLNNSLMEDLQKAVPQANFVKAFNSIGSQYMVNPNFGTPPTMFICGNEIESKKEVSEILQIFGFDVEDFGEMESARAIRTSMHALVHSWYA